MSTTDDSQSREGSQGEQGEPGTPTGAGGTGGSGGTGGTGGVGDTGDKGARGDRGRPGRSLTRTQALSGVVLVSLAVVLATYRSEVNSHRITNLVNTQQVSRYQSCLGGISILQHINDGYLALIKVEQDTDYPTPVGVDLSARRIAAYRSALVTPLPTCDDLKP